MALSRETSASPTQAVQRRRFGACLTAGFVLFALAGCGFQPLNTRSASNNGAQTGERGSLDELAAIRIAPLSDRAGQEMHNFLRDRLNPSGQPTAPKYELVVRLSESIREVALESDETATRADLSIVANYSLRRFDNQQVLSRGRSRSVSSYNILEEQFASTISEADARSRTLRDIADDIRVRLSAYFSANNAASGS